MNTIESPEVSSVLKRPCGRVDIHSGIFKGFTFDTPQQPVQILQDLETAAEGVSIVQEKAYLPVLVFSAIDAVLGVKERKISRVARGIAGISLGLGLKKMSPIYEESAGVFSVEREKLEDGLRES